MFPAVGGENVVYDLLSDVLDAIVATFEQAGLDLPARRYVYFGRVAADCEQLTVTLDQLYRGTPGSDPNELQRCNAPRTAAMTVQLFQKTASLGARGSSPVPSVSSLDHSAQKHLQYTWTMLDAADEVASRLNAGVLSELVAQEAQGEHVSITMTLTVVVP